MVNEALPRSWTGAIQTFLATGGSLLDATRSLSVALTGSEDAVALADAVLGLHNHAPFDAVEAVATLVKRTKGDRSRFAEVLAKHQIHAWSIAMAAKGIGISGVRTMGRDLGLTGPEAEAIHPSNQGNFPYKLKPVALGIEELPAGLIIPGRLILAHSPTLKRLPVGLMVKYTLDLRGCAFLESLPEGLHVEGIAMLDACQSLRTVPGGIFFGDRLSLSRSKGLETIEGPLFIHGSVYAEDCTSLNEIRGPIEIEGDLILRGSYHLRYLPEDMKIHRNLELTRCRSILGLPKGLRVGRNLIIVDCDCIAGRVPADAVIGGSVTREKPLPAAGIGWLPGLGR